MQRAALPETVPGSDLSVNELIVAYLRHADAYYMKNGKPTAEPANLRFSFRVLRQLYGHTSASEFGPLALKTVRAGLIETGLCRSEVNRRISRILRLFKWAVSEEIVPPSSHHALQSVPGLRRGRADVRESEPVRPVCDAFVDPIRPFVARQVWAMVELQRLTGMRPGEVCSMRTVDLDTSGKIWTYTPASHKTEHHGKERRIYLGPQAQEILRPWLRADPGASLFSPAEAMADRRAEMRASRKTPVQPSQQDRTKKRPEKQPGEVYTTESYRRAVAYGIKRANIERAKGGQLEIPSWHPHRFRHSAATRLRKEFGLDVTRAVLGHSSAVVTEMYAEMDGTKAAEAMGRVG